MGSDSRTRRECLVVETDPSSLIVSAGMSAMSRSWRSAGRPEMSCPQQPGGSDRWGRTGFAATTLDSAPLALTSRSSRGASAAQSPAPVTTQCVSARRATRSRPAAKRMRSEVTAPTPFSYGRIRVVSWLAAQLREMSLSDRIPSRPARASACAPRRSTCWRIMRAVSDHSLSM